MTTPSSTVIARRNDEAISRLNHRDGAASLVMTHSTHPFELVNQSCTGYTQNNFAVFLTNLLGQKITGQLLQRYYICTSKHWQGATVFWQIDSANRARAGKIMLYHSPTGKRVKQPYSHIAWVHSILKYHSFKLQQCFFGEHLLKTNLLKPVAIVESEKTAVIASVHLPEFIWLATGSLSSLTKEKCAVLKGRRVVLFPDANGFKMLSENANELSVITPITVSDMLEKNTTPVEKANGFDLADYLIKAHINP